MKHIKRILTLLFVLGLLVSVAYAAESGDEQAQASAAVSAPKGLPYSDQEWEILQIVNTHRHEAGLLPLTGVLSLQKATDVRSQELTVFYSHTRPDGRDCFSAIDEAGVEFYGYAGENIAAGQTTPAMVMNSWMHSEGHYRNIMSSVYDHIGVGYTYEEGTTYRHHWVQLFMSGGDYISMTLEAPNGTTFPAGTTVEEMGLYAVLTSRRHGECHLPIISAYCPDFDYNLAGTKTLSISFFGFSAGIDITIESDGIWSVQQNGGKLYFDPETQLIVGTENIYNLEVPASISGKQVLGIADGLFLDNFELRSVTLPEGLQSIGSYAFSGCYLLESLNIPASVNHIGEAALMGTSRLKLQLAEDHPHFRIIDGMLVSSDTVLHCLAVPGPELTFPESITKIGAGAFYGCDVLEIITFHDKFVYIGEKAFGSCSLDHVRFTGAPLTLGPWAFDNSRAVTIYYPIDAGEWNKADYPTLSACWWAHYCLTHEWDEGSIWRKPTHESDGIMGYACLDCNETREEVIPAPADHSYTTETRLPTCTHEGNTRYTCTICGYSYLGDNVPPTGHSFTEWAGDGELSCTEGRNEYRSCTVCGKEESRGVPALGHDTQSVVTPPTCTREGYTTHTCLRCGYENTTDAQRPLGHSFGDWFIATEPTCTEYGTLRRVCAICGDAEEDWLESLGHSFEDTVVPSTCTQEGYTLHTCTRCDYSHKDNLIPPASHSFGQWKTVTEATCADEGLERRSCDVCGEIEENETPKRAHDYQISVVAPTCTTEGFTNHSCRLCGHSYSDAATPALGHTPGEAHITNRAPDGSHDLITFCTVCADVVSSVHVEGSAAVPGDVNGDGSADLNDAIYLLFHALFGSGDYPVASDCDFDGSGAADVNDAIYLLFHFLFGAASYPLN